MNKYRQIDKLIMKYLIMAAVIILLITNYEQLFNWLAVIWSVLRPIFMGAIIAYVINLLMIQFEKIYFPNRNKKWVKVTRRPLSIVLSFLVITLILALIIGLIAPQLISVFATIFDTLPELFEMVEDWVMDYESLFPQAADLIQEVDIDWQELSSSVLDMMNNFTGNVVETMISTIGSVFGFIVNLFLAFIISIYVLLSKEKLIEQFKRLSSAYLPKHIDGGLRYVTGVVDDSFKNFLVGETIEAAILGSLVAISMWIFQFPYAGMIGALTGVTAYIPYVGAYISAGVGVLLILVESPFQALLFLILIMVIQQIESNVIYPRVVGQSIGLSGLWVIVGVTIGGGLWGVGGMLIGVPISSALYRLLKDNVRKREKIKNRRQILKP